jgi:hypothetical protein
MRWESIRNVALYCFIAFYWHFYASSFLFLSVRQRTRQLTEVSDQVYGNQSFQYYKFPLIFLPIFFKLVEK